MKCQIQLKGLQMKIIDPNEFKSSDYESAQTLLQTYVHVKGDTRQGKCGLRQKFWLL